MNLECRSGYGASLSRTGVVVIGRNEGERLMRCLRSVAGMTGRIVYVDSASSDGSAQAARAAGVHVVSLDGRTRCTAARARNQGFRRLRELLPGVAYVQFLDGDCELRPAWLRTGVSFLHAHPQVAVVAGRLRERHRQQSLYNMLCDMEWDAPAGASKACGGNALMRADAFRQAGGFRADLIAGEEPELCVRLRRAGWRVWRLKSEMALHDAAMTRFAQWWKRCTRCGYAFAQGASLHGASPERHWVKESRSAWLWGLALPLASIAAAGLLGPMGFAILLAYPLQVLRLSRCGGRASRRENFWRALFIVLGKFPELAGQAKFFLDRALGARAALIDYE